MLNTFRQIIDTLDQQPLFSFEWQMSQRRISLAHGWGRWFNLLLGWSVVLVSIALYIIEFIRALRGGDLNIVPYDMRWLMGVYAVLALIFYTTPWRRGSTLAQQIVGRDKSNLQKWELVVLTGVDAQSYVRAKWWALVRALLPMMSLIAIVRAGAVTFLATEFTRSAAANATRYGNVTVYEPHPLNILLIGVLSFVFVYANLPLLCAIHVDSALDSRRNGNTWMGSFMRGAVLFGSGLCMVCGGFNIFSRLGTIFSNAALSIGLGYVMLTVLDNGLLITGTLGQYVYTYNASGRIEGTMIGVVWFTIIVALLANVALGLFWLKMAEWTAERYELVPRDSVPSERQVDVPHPLESIR